MNLSHQTKWVQLTWFPTTGKNGKFDLPVITQFNYPKQFTSHRGTVFGPYFFGHSWSKAKRALHGVFPVEHSKIDENLNNRGKETHVFKDSSILATWSFAPKPVGRFKAKILQDVTARRYNVEVGGIVHNGSVISTTHESQTKLASALAIVSADPEQTFEWKVHNAITGEIEWMALDAAGIKAVALLVKDHVQTAYSNEKVHLKAVGELTEVEDILGYGLDVGWPPNPDPFTIDLE